MKPYDGKLHVGGFQLNTTEYNRKSKETPWKAYVPSIVDIYNRTEIVLPVPFFLQSHGSGSRYFSISMTQTLQVILRTLYATILLIHPSIHLLLICLSIHSFITLLFIHSDIQFLSVVSLILYLLHVHELFYYLSYFCICVHPYH